MIFDKILIANNDVLIKYSTTKNKVVKTTKLYYIIRKKFLTENRDETKIYWESLEMMIYRNKAGWFGLLSAFILNGCEFWFFLFQKPHVIFVGSFGWSFFDCSIEHINEILDLDCLFWKVKKLFNTFE